MNTALVLSETSEDFQKKFNDILKNYRIIFKEDGNTASIDADTASEISIIFGNPKADFLKLCPKLKWIQLQSAGANGFIDGELDHNVLLTCASGCYGLAVSEHMIALTLALVKNLHLYRDVQFAQTWQSRGKVKGIKDSVVLVIGIGDIGSNYARRMKALGSYIIGVDILNYKKPDYLDEFLPVAKMDEALGRADIVALAVPGTKHTTGLIGRTQIAKMKHGAVLINACRGVVVDTEALCDALESGALNGAGLDVTDPEPLPPGHRLWKQEKAIITPHIAGGRHLAATWEFIQELCLENAQRFVRDEPLKNLVDFKTGYRFPDPALIQ